MLRARGIDQGFTEAHGVATGQHDLATFVTERAGVARRRPGRARPRRVLEQPGWKRAPRVFVVYVSSSSLLPSTRRSVPTRSIRAQNRSRGRLGKRFLPTRSRRCSPPAGDGIANRLCTPRRTSFASAGCTLGWKKNWMSPRSRTILDRWHAFGPCATPVGTQFARASADVRSAIVVGRQENIAAPTNAAATNCRAAIRRGPLPGSEVVDRHQ